MTDLVHLPVAELARIRALPIPAAERAAIFADACRLNTLYMIGRAGSGHIGTSFSCLDIVSWLFLEEGVANVDDPLRPRYFSSKGHDAPALYAVLIGLGLLGPELLHRLRRLDGLPGHPDVATPFVETNTGSLGMGISKARGMVLAERLRGRRVPTYVLTGDGELQEGQFWESLQPVANARLDEITVIVDHNKVQSDTLLERVSPLGDLERKLAAFGWGVARCDGHDVAAVATALRDFGRDTGRPHVLVADTIKGRGVSFMEHTAMPPDARLYRFHSGAPDAETYERAARELISRIDRRLEAAGAGRVQPSEAPYPVRSVDPAAQRLVKAYGEALVREAERDARIVALDGDLALDTGLLPFEARFPDRFIECGIAEQDMVSVAGGLARRGMLPVVHSFACFLSTRPNEQIFNNATERTKIVYVGSLAGLLPGGPGHSHQSLRDIGSLANVPGLILLEPATEREVRAAVEWIFRSAETSCYLRLSSVPWTVPFDLPEDHRLELGRGTRLTDGADVALFSYGPVMLSQAFRASELLRPTGVGVAVYDLPWLDRVDPAWLRAAIEGRRLVVTVDDHSVVGGQGAMVGSVLAQLAIAPSPAFLPLGIEGIPACGQNDEVLRHHRLDAGGIAQRIAERLAVD